MNSENFELATFGGGCFWCIEAVFQRLEGVRNVVSGYAGGQTPNPTYEQVCSGRTGHAEVIQVEFDPQVISYEELLDVFFRSHDPTTLNRQGNDVGTQYRSVIYYHLPHQKHAAEAAIERLDASGELPGPVVTQVQSAPQFYPAETYHQNYYNDNPHNGYCQFVVRDKVTKAKKLFGQRFKPGV